MQLLYWFVIRFHTKWKCINCITRIAIAKVEKYVCTATADGDAPDGIKSNWNIICTSKRQYTRLEIERSCNVLLAHGDHDVNNRKSLWVEQQEWLIVFTLESDGVEYFVLDTL